MPALVGVWVWLNLAANHPHAPVWQAPEGARMGSKFAVTVALAESLPASTPPLKLFQHQVVSRLYTDKELLGYHHNYCLWADMRRGIIICDKQAPGAEYKRQYHRIKSE
jgi:hypothetical protein